ncbi:ABC transporter ATP-binding protein [Bradyrhizobium manausense]|uniref:ABC transporter ATP-binding protein n=1 Tax=Bradyrhizobium manausense TaxID=989370 RepID=UPI001BA65E52|nr:ABC transporter ATP-binding protein [Bradyrhizobium manausense]MBR0725539.1 ABC transporter ATP-binding protein [Bradyrhizobium manausense]MBR0834202.1 ABC transporter ATP-binding protein [Bradyrhizobium manausense]
MIDDVLSIEHLTVAITASSQGKTVVSDVSLSVGRKEIVCVVGESGSGKSVTSFSIMGILSYGLAPATGSIKLLGEELIGASATRMRKLRGLRMAMIFQEPMTALNPVMTVGDQIAEIFRYHRPEMSASDVRLRVRSLAEDVRLPDPANIVRRYPHQLSGGQRQRIMIAMALALEPALLIADEPTTALDVTTQKQILELICDLVARRGIGVLFITHDFGVVAEIADRVVVMRSGSVVESGSAHDVLTQPQQAYTRSLIDAVPGSKLPKARDVADHVVLRVENLSKTYGDSSGLFGPAHNTAPALLNASLSLRKGEILGIVGESGSGKSTLARCICRLQTPSSGDIWLGDINIARMHENKLRNYRKAIQVVFQDPNRSLNPRLRIGETLVEGARNFGASARVASERSRRLLDLVGLDDSALDRFPHQFSGGQRQRICIARALASEPDILVADEAVSALDVSVQAQVIELLEDLRQRLGLAIIFITHDLRVAGQLCDRLIVMQSGRIVEQGPTGRLFDSPSETYTRELLAAAPGREFLASARKA